MWTSVFCGTHIKPKFCNNLLCFPPQGITKWKSKNKARYLVLKIMVRSSFVIGSIIIDYQWM